MPISRSLCSLGCCSLPRGPSLMLSLQNSTTGIIWIVHKCPHLLLPESFQFSLFLPPKTLVTLEMVPVQKRQGLRQHQPPFSSDPIVGHLYPSSDTKRASQQMGARPLQPKTPVLNSRPQPEEGCVIYKVRQQVQGWNQRLLSRWRKETHICRGPNGTQLILPLPRQLWGAFVLVSGSEFSLPWFPPAGNTGPIGMRWHAVN